MSRRVEFRVVWRRDGMARPKVKRFAGLPSAERFVGLLTSDEPWLFMRDQSNPDDYFCCSGYQCNCHGITVRQRCADVRAELPPIEYVRIERRSCDPWEVAAASPDREGR